MHSDSRAWRRRGSGAACVAHNARPVCACARAWEMRGDRTWVLHGCSAKSASSHGCDVPLSLSLVRVCAYSPSQCGPGPCVSMARARPSSRGVHAVVRRVQRVHGECAACARRAARGMHACLRWAPPVAITGGEQRGQAVRYTGTECAHARTERRVTKERMHHRSIVPRLLPTGYDAIVPPSLARRTLNADTLVEHYWRIPCEARV